MVSPVVIELNDACLVAARDGDVLVREPGYALLDGRAVRHGDTARQQARIAPQRVSHRFWDTLDQSSVPSEGQWRLSPAELAFGQLEGMWQKVGDPDAPAVLLVPPTFTRAQLGLILGMCRKAGINVVSLVDSALASLSSVGDTRQAIVVDLTLHRVAGARFAIDDRVQRQATAEIDQFGLMDYQRRFAATLGDVCVRKTRFDPMHSAESEQRLYDDLDAVLGQLHDAPEATWQAQTGDDTIAVTVARQDLASAVAELNTTIDGLIDQLIDPALGTPMVFVSHRLDFWPDLVGELGHAHGGVRVLPPLAAVSGATLDLATFARQSEHIGLILERPRRGLSLVTSDAAPRTVSSKPASHILVDQKIYRIADAPFVVGTATTSDQWGHRATGNVKGVSRRHLEIMRRDARVLLRDLSTYGTWVNGRKVDGEVAVAAGDVVRLGNPGLELRLVQETAFDGQA
ncbi:MAG: FHA domain-containing protein [Pseudomonadota bacterium]